MYLHRIVINAVVDGVAGNALPVAQGATRCTDRNRRVANHLAVAQMTDEHRIFFGKIYGIDCIERCRGEIERLTTLPRCEQRSITGGCSLYNLVLDREQIDSILTSLRIRMDSDTLLGKQRAGVAYLLHHCVARQIIRIMN